MAKYDRVLKVRRYRIASHMVSLSVFGILAVALIVCRALSYAVSIEFLDPEKHWPCPSLLPYLKIYATSWSQGTY